MRFAARSDSSTRPAQVGTILAPLPVSVALPVHRFLGLSFVLLPLGLGLVLHPQVPADVYLEGAITRQSGLSRDHQGPRAVLNAPERLATGKGPDVSELADRIKALKAANTIEAAPQRARQKQAAAEKPVTARIRRRQKANTETGEAIKPVEALAAEAALPQTADAANDNHHAANDNRPPGSAVKPPSFQQRIALERQRKDEGPRLP